MAQKSTRLISVYGSILGVGCIALVVGLVFWVDPEPTAVRFVEDKTDHEAHSIASSNPPARTVDGTQFPPRRVQQAWFQLGDDEQPTLAPGKKLPEGAVHVRVSDLYKEWLLGTPVEVHIPQNDETYDALVERITPDSFGNTTIHAVPNPSEEVFERLILTYDSKSTLAYVSTTVGSYELTASGDIGLLVPGSSLGVTKDPTLPDVGTSKRWYEDAEYVPQRTD